MVLVVVLMMMAMAAMEAARGDPNEFVYGLCNTQSYEANSTLALRVNKALGTLAERSGTSLYSFYNARAKAEKNGTEAQSVYSMYACRGDATLAQCRACVGAIVVAPPCGHAIGTRVQLRACFLRYETYAFAGTQDFSIVDVGCSSSTNSSSSSSTTSSTTTSSTTSSTTTTTSTTTTSSSSSSSSSLSLSSSYRSDLDSALRIAARSAPLSGPLRFNSTSVGSAFALAQCLPYLPPSACRTCLSQVSDRASFCPRSASGFAYFVTCFFLFDDKPLTL
jgi:hypothetical protein